MDAGNTAWMLISTGLVLFMTPGLAFFYGGMVRAKNVLGMLMQNFFAMGVLAIIWVAIAFSLAHAGVITRVGQGTKNELDPSGRGLAVQQGHLHMRRCGLAVRRIAPEPRMVR